MKEFRVSFCIEVPDDVMDDELERWLKFALYAACSIDSATLDKIESAEKEITSLSVS